MEIISQEIVGEYQVTTYSNGVIVKVLKNEEVAPGTTVPIPLTFEQRLKSVEDAQNFLLGL